MNRGTKPGKLRFFTKEGIDSTLAFARGSKLVGLTSTEDDIELK